MRKTLSGNSLQGVPLEDRVADHLRRREWWSPGGRALVALSGGMDSMVLLHLLRFTRVGRGMELRAAHFDHGMRPESGEDAVWLRGLCAAWRVPLTGAKASRVPANEGEARSLRYRFLNEVRGEDELLLTAHHADDQVETLLFRLVRGTGPAGMQGIPEWRAPGVARPLLPFTREELRGYAVHQRVPSRFDPTNRDLSPSRNRIRHRLLPELEAVHPGARRSILRLARLSSRREEAFRTLLKPHLEGLIRSRGEGWVTFARDIFLAYPSPVQAELLRALARELGGRLSERGTASAGAFIKKGASGGRVELSESLLLSREFGTFRLERGSPPPAGAGETMRKRPDPLVLSTAEGEARFSAGRRTYRVRWGREGNRRPSGEGEWSAVLPRSPSAGPWVLRTREPGDRVPAPGGTRRLKRLLGELRVPWTERASLPLLVDPAGRVVWIPGRWTAPGLSTASGEETWTIGVRDVGDDT